MELGNFKVQVMVGTIKSKFGTPNLRSLKLKENGSNSTTAADSRIVISVRHGSDNSESHYFTK